MIETVVKQAVMKVVATFTGLGAIANVIQAIYNARSFFREQASQIQALVNAVKDSIGNIAAGQVGAATNYIESALARSLSVAINFLARQVGLGNVGQKVREIIQRVRVRVDAAVNKLIEYVAQQGNNWLAKAGRGRSNNQQPMPNNRPKPQPTTQNRPGQNNRQPAPNQRPKPQPATQNRPGQNNQKPTPKLTPAEIRQHEQMANEAVRQLENTNGRLKDYNTTRAEKIAQARRMKPNYDRRLKSPIKFNVDFEPNTANAELDGDLDFKVIIAPNTTKKSGSVPTKKRDDYLTPAKQKLGMERFTREEFQTEFGLSKTTAITYLKYWVDKNQLFKYASGGSDSFTQYSFDPNKGGDRDYLELAKQEFGMERFTRAQFEKQFNVSEATALRHLNKWIRDGQLYQYLSAIGDTLTQYTFDINQGGKRETEEGNRSKYG